MEIRNAQAPDLQQIMAIEATGFTPDEAASELAMAERIEKISDSFLVAEVDQEILGYVVGPVISERFIQDDLFEKCLANPQAGGYQSILSLAVAPLAQQKGVAGNLLVALAENARNHQRQGITLTCLGELIPFYEKYGFKNEGISDSQHAGEVWYNLVIDL